MLRSSILGFATSHTSSPHLLKDTEFCEFFLLTWTISQTRGVLSSFQVLWARPEVEMILFERCYRYWKIFSLCCSLQALSHSSL